MRTPLCCPYVPRAPRSSHPSPRNRLRSVQLSLVGGNVRVISKRRWAARTAAITRSPTAVASAHNPISVLAATHGRNALPRRQPHQTSSQKIPFMNLGPAGCARGVELTKHLSGLDQVGKGHEPPHPGVTFSMLHIDSTPLQTTCRPRLPDTPARDGHRKAREAVDTQFPVEWLREELLLVSPPGTERTWTVSRRWHCAPQRAPTGNIRL